MIASPHSLSHDLQLSVTTASIKNASKLQMKMSLKTCKIWDVKIGPSRSSQISTRFASKITVGRKKKRRICIEVWGPRCDHSAFTSRAFVSMESTSSSTSNDSESSGQSFEATSNLNQDICISGIDNNLMRKLLSGNKFNTVENECDLLPNEQAYIRVYKSEEKEKKKLFNSSLVSPTSGKPSMSNKKMHVQNGDHYRNAKQKKDDGTISTLGLLDAYEKPDKQNWVEEYCYKIENVQLLHRVKNKIAIRMTNGEETIQRLISFGSGIESRSLFEVVMNYQNSLQHLKQNQLLSLHVSGNSLDTLIESENDYDSV